MPTLATYVHVRDDAGEAHVFGPGDEVPAWAVDRITNPLAWDEPPTQVDAREPEPVKAPAKRAPARRKAATADDDAVHGG